MENIKEDSVCTVCGVLAQTKYVEFGRVASYLIFTKSTTETGTMCKSCIVKSFRQTTKTTALTGWFSILGFFSTPVMLVHNIIRFWLCRKLHPVPRGASRPSLNEFKIQSFTQYDSQIRVALLPGCNFQEVVYTLSDKLKVDRGELVLYIHYRHYDRLIY